jgi:hypothetical protein
MIDPDADTQSAPTQAALAWSQHDPAPYRRPRRLPPGLAWTFGGAFAIGLICLAVTLAARPLPRPTPSTVPSTGSIPGPTQTSIFTPALQVPDVDAQRQTPPQVAPPTPTPSTGGIDAADQRFVRLVRDDGFTVYDPAALVAAGHAACAHLALTHNLYQTVKWMQVAYDGPFDSAHEVVIAASSVLCPGTPG